MEKPNIPTLPVRQVTRKRIAIRLTDKERAEISVGEAKLNCPTHTWHGISYWKWWRVTAQFRRRTG
jgi:hypothetical protein